LSKPPTPIPGIALAASTSYLDPDLASVREKLERSACRPDRKSF
jgi:hypothetical protein